MPISSVTTPRTQYNGSGTTGPFSTLFVFVNEADLKVIKTSTAGVDTTLTITTNYTVTGGGPGGATGAVTLTSALAVGEKLTIIRQTALTQEVDYIPNDKFPAETHEGALNKLTLIAQELDNKVSSLGITLSETSGLTDIIFPSPGAGEWIKWNSAGTALETATAAMLGIVTAGTGLSLSTSSVMSLLAGLNDLTGVTITGAVKGDILVFDGTNWVDLTVGSNGTLLSANSAETTGLEWIASTTYLANIVEDVTPALGGTLDAATNDITNVGSLDAADLALTTGATVTAILDEDTMTSNSATALATQQSIKTYVDTGLSNVVGSGEQEWTNVSGSRAVATVYTNTSGAPIMVAVSFISTGAGSLLITGTTDSKVIISNSITAEGTDWTAGVTFIVKNGETYQIDKSGSATYTINTWYELA